MTTITKGATTITPTLILGYKAETDSANVEHQLIGGGMRVSLADDLPREGELELFFAEREDAFAAYELHRTTGVFTLTDTDIPEAGMLYVRKGGLTIALEPDGRRRWLVTVGFREVLS